MLGFSILWQVILRSGDLPQIVSDRASLRVVQTLAQNPGRRLGLFFQCSGFKVRGVGVHHLMVRLARDVGVPDVFCTGSVGLQVKHISGIFGVRSLAAGFGLSVPSSYLGYAASATLEVSFRLQGQRDSGRGS